MAQTLQINLYGDITTWSVRDLVHQLQAAPEADVLLRINSPGGDVTEGFALANVLRSHSGRKTAVVEGVCASAATFPACACDVVQMHPESLLMVHCPWGISEGGVEDLESYAAVLAKMETLCVGMYARKTGATEDQVRAWMKSETWMTPEEARVAGFCDEILTAPSPPAARAHAARYVAMFKGRPKTKDKTKMPKAAFPDTVQEKLAKHGLAEAPSKEDVMAAYKAYMADTDDGPAERKEMARCLDDWEKEPTDDKTDPAAKLRSEPGLDPAVAKLLESFTDRAGKMERELAGYKASEARRSESEFYTKAILHTTREEAKEYVALCDGSFDKALKLIGKLPKRPSAMTKWLSGSEPGSEPAKNGGPVEKTKTIHNGLVVLHGHGLSVMARKVATERKVDIITAQRIVAKEHPELLQREVVS